MILNMDTLISELHNLVYIQPEDEVTLASAATALVNEHNNESDNSPDST